MNTRSMRGQRRRLLLALSLGALAARSSLAGAPVTPADAEGPYYPPQRPPTAANNLRAVAGQRPAEGTPLDLEGRVLDAAGKTLAGVLVEIWQTDARGNYIHPRAPLQSGSARDPGFAGYGRSVTDAQGRWRFATVRPVGYFGRPPHIHVKLWLGGREVLTTQLYFPDMGGRRDLMIKPGSEVQGVGQAGFDFVVPAT
jgi:protocatechuate 3,4-dioxygenase beta subunit